MIATFKKEVFKIACVMGEITIVKYIIKNRIPLKYVPFSLVLTFKIRDTTYFFF
jgi:hypothetical protein